MIRVLAAASSPIARAGLESLLQGEPRLAVIAASADLDRLESLTESHRPDVAVVLLEEPGLEPPPVLVALLTGGLPLIVLTREAPIWALDALKSGLRAILPRTASAPEIVAAIEAAYTGLTVLHPATLNDVLNPHSDERTSLSPSADSLTPREAEILRRLAEGEGNKTIAFRLGISEHTVKFHVASIMAKLGAQSRTEAVTLGVRRGLILL